MGFVTHSHQWNICSLRRLASPTDTCSADLQTTSGPFNYYARQGAPGCGFNASFCPADGPPPPGPPPPAAGKAAYAIPIPFLPGRRYAKIRLELTVGDKAPTELELAINGTKVYNKHHFCTFLNAFLTPFPAPSMAPHTDT